MTTLQDLLDEVYARWQSPPRRPPPYRNDAPAPRYEDLQGLQDRFFADRAQQRRAEDEAAASAFYAADAARRLPDAQAQYDVDPLHTPGEANAIMLSRAVVPGAYDAGQAMGRIAQGENAWGDLALNAGMAALPFAGLAARGPRPAPELPQRLPDAPTRLTRIYRGINQEYDPARAALLGDRWWHTNPEVASTYAPGGEGAHVIPGLMDEAQLRLAHVDAPPGTMWRNIPVEALPQELRRAFPRSTTRVTSHEVAAAAESAGFDGISFSGVRDSGFAGAMEGPYPGFKTGDHGRVVALFNNNAVRPAFGGELPQRLPDAPPHGGSATRPARTPLDAYHAGAPSPHSAGSDRYVTVYRGGDPNGQFWTPNVETAGAYSYKGEAGGLDEGTLDTHGFGYAEYTAEMAHPRSPNYVDPGDWLRAQIKRAEDENLPGLILDGVSDRPNWDIQRQYIVRDRSRLRDVAAYEPEPTSLPSTGSDVAQTPPARGDVGPIRVYHGSPHEPRTPPNANPTRPSPRSPKSLPRRKPPQGGFFMPGARP